MVVQRGFAKQSLVHRSCPPRRRAAAMAQANPKGRTLTTAREIDVSGVGLAAFRRISASCLSKGQSPHSIVHCSNCGSLGQRSCWGGACCLLHAADGRVDAIDASPPSLALSTTTFGRSATRAFGRYVERPHSSALSWVIATSCKETLMQDDRDNPTVAAQEWTEAIQSVIAFEGTSEADHILTHVVDVARRSGARLPFAANTAYINSIPPDRQPQHPGDRSIEHRIRSEGRGVVCIHRCHVPVEKRTSDGLGIDRWRTAPAMKAACWHAVSTTALRVPRASRLRRFCMCAPFFDAQYSIALLCLVMLCVKASTGVAGGL